MANNEIEAMLSFEHPDNIATVKGLASDSGFNQVCLTYDSKYVTFFINNVIFLRVPQIFHMLTLTFNRYFSKKFPQLVSFGSRSVFWLLVKTALLVVSLEISMKF